MIPSPGDSYRIGIKDSGEIHIQGTTKTEEAAPVGLKADVS